MHTPWTVHGHSLHNPQPIHGLHSTIRGVSIDGPWGGHGVSIDGPRRVYRQSCTPHGPSMDSAGQSMGWARGAHSRVSMEGPWRIHGQSCIPDRPSMDWTEQSVKHSLTARGVGMECPWGVHGLSLGCTWPVGGVYMGHQCTPSDWPWMPHVCSTDTARTVHRYHGVSMDSP